MTPLIIGNAALYNAPCETVLQSIGPVDAIITDFPYLFKTSGGGKWRKARNNMERIAARGLNKGFDINTFDPSLYKSFITFCSNDQLHLILPWLAKNYRRHAVLDWEKTNPVPMANRAYAADKEFYVHGWQRGAHPLGNKFEDMRRSVKCAVGKSKWDHPTVKPDKVMDKIMINVNAATILDPLMGSGSTGIAALKAGKKFIGVERDPQSFFIACARIAEFYSTADNSRVPAPIGV